MQAPELHHCVCRRRGAAALQGKRGEAAVATMNRMKDNEGQMGAAMGDCLSPAGCFDQAWSAIWNKRYDKRKDERMTGNMNG